MKLVGKWKAIVTNINDPEKRGRIKVHIPELLYDEEGNLLESNWAEPCFPAGMHNLPKVGDGVWIEFEAPCDDINKPIWTGWYQSMPQGKSEAPDTAQGIEDASVQEVRGTDKFEGSEYVEPQSAYDSRKAYGNVKVWSTPGGFKVELDDANNRLMIYHPEGWFYEIGPRGTTEEKVGKKWQTIAGASIIHVWDEKIESIESNAQQTIDGSEKRKIGQSKEEYIGRDYVQTVKGRKVLSSRSVKETIKGNDWKGCLGERVRNVVGGSKLSAKSNLSFIESNVNEIILGHDLAEGAAAKSLDIYSGDYRVTVENGTISLTAGRKIRLGSHLPTDVGPLRGTAPRAIEPLIKGTSFNSGLNSFLSSFAAFLAEVTKVWATLAGAGLIATHYPAIPEFLREVTLAFQTSLPTFLSRVCEIE
jgi:hypothetical protein